MSTRKEQSRQDEEQLAAQDIREQYSMHIEFH